MNNKFRKPNSESLASRLLRVVFSLYVVVVVCATAGQMVLEYQYQKHNISRDLSNIQITFEHVLAGQIWNLDEEALYSTVKGIIELPTVVGIQIYDTEGDIIAHGGIVKEGGDAGKSDLYVALTGYDEDKVKPRFEKPYLLEMFECDFPLIYGTGQNTKHLGSAVFYSNTSVIFRRVRLAFFLLSIVAALQMIALWFIFKMVLNRLLKKPLTHLTEVVQGITPDNLSSVRVDFHSAVRDELVVLSEAFNRMIADLREAGFRRAQAASDLRASEERLNSILKAAPVGIGLMRNRVYEGVNPAMCMLTGYSREELIGQSARRLYFSDDVFNRIGKVLKNQIHQYGTGATEVTWCKKDGSKVHVYVSATPLNPKDPDGSITFCALDITDRKAAEEALRASAKKLALHIEQSPLGVIGWSLDFEVVEWNAAATWIFGYTKREALGCNAKFIIPKKDWGNVDDIWEKLQSKTGGTHSVNENITKDGKSIFCEWHNTPLVDDDGIVIGVASQVMDVTHRKEVEEEHERLMLAIEQSIDMVVITDKNGHILYVNPAFEKTTGYSRDEVIGKNPHILNSGHHPPEFFKEMWETLSSGEPWVGKISNRKKDGTVYVEDATITPVTNEKGEIINYVAAKHDATRELELEDQLRQSQKMRAVGQMAGGIAHDFNNLLQVISGYAELSEMMLPKDHELYPAIQEIGETALRGKGLINQLLAFSRRQIIKPEDLNLNDVIESLLNMIRGLIWEHIDLNFEAGKDLETVHIDRGLMEQMLVNLCVNARDAMPHGGVLAIKTENITMDEQYASQRSWAQPGSYVRLSIADSGEGMDETTLEHIFEPFFTTKEVGKGTGLGLSSVFGIVKQHNGHIDVTSKAGEGSVFEIYLPAVNRVPVNHMLLEADAEIDKLGGKETILVAEDDESILALTMRLLTDAGYTVLTARNGEEAVEMFKKHKDEIDLVMLDVIMPQLSGKEALEKIHQLQPDLPHLFASGYSEDAVHTNFIQKQGLNLLAKPYQAEDLLQKIRDILNMNKS